LGREDKDLLSPYHISPDKRSQRLTETSLIAKDSSLSSGKSLSTFELVVKSKLTPLIMSSDLIELFSFSPKPLINSLLRSECFHSPLSLNHSGFLSPSFTLKGIPLIFNLPTLTNNLVHLRTELNFFF